MGAAIANPAMNASRCVFTPPHSPHTLAKCQYPRELFARSLLGKCWFPKPFEHPQGPMDNGGGNVLHLSFRRRSGPQPHPRGSLTLPALPRTDSPLKTQNNTKTKKPLPPAERSEAGGGRKGLGMEGRGLALPSSEQKRTSRSGPQPRPRGSLTLTALPRTGWFSLTPAFNDRGKPRPLAQAAAEKPRETNPKPR